MAKSYKERLEELQTLSSPASAIAAYSVEDPVMVEADDDWELDDKYKSTDPNPYGKRYEDEHISYIDDKKNVKIDENQINLTQENRSQYIPFEMFRYYDGIDLKNMQLSIYYLNPDNAEGESEPINVRYSDTKIRFGFLLPAEATAVAGKLRFEIWAKGTNPFGDKYWLKTKPNSEIEILESLHGNGNIIVDEEWATSVLSQVQKAASDAQTAATNAQTSLDQAETIRSELYNKIDSVEDDITIAVENSLKETHYNKEETDSAIDTKIESAVNNIDGLANFKSTYDKETGKLAFYNGEELMEGSPHTLMTNPTDEWSTSYKNTINTEIVTPAIDALKEELNNHSSESDNRMTTIEGDITSLTDKFDDYYNKEETYNKDKVNELIENVEVDLSGYATETYVDNKDTALSSSISANTENISSLSGVVTTLQSEVNAIDKSPRVTYDVAYNDPDDENVGENAFVLYEIKGEGTEDEEKEIKKKFIITGGSGGGTSGGTLKIGYVTTSPLVATADDKVLIKYSFTGTDSSGDEIAEGTYTWKIGSKTIATGIAVSGENTFDATDFVSIGSQKLTLQIKDDGGSLVTKAWTVQIVDVRIESTFNDTQTYPIGKPVSFSYTPYGAIQKTIHFKLDGEDLYTVNTTSSGVPMSYNIQPKEHGSHLVEVYITAEINNSTIESNHVCKDVIWYDSTSEIPVIGCISKDLEINQYDTANITYTVFDPSTETPTVTLAVDGKTVSTLTLDTNTQTWQYKGTEVGSHVLTITCGQTVKTINIEVKKLDIDVTPVTAGLEFDFNPVGYSNNDAERLWTDEDTGVNMTVSDNFDWVNGGYQTDDNGDQYFCVKAGTTATINYNLFADDPKRNGKEFKVIFKTTKVKNRATSFIQCMDSGIGIDMKIEKAYIYSSNAELFSPYCEDDIIEFEFNINKDTDIPMVLTYEDGTGNRPMIYTSDASFAQTTPQPILIGSEDCDVHIYRMKVYSNSLSDRDILSNFIADARNAEEMINRYKRNQIYDENGSMTPEVLAEKCPDLRVIVVDAPWFTNDKSDKVSDTTITMIYKNGDPILDNWTCTGGKHSGQGTSSNEYGYSGRNLDLIMDGDEVVFTFGDGTTTGKTFTLTRNSVPTDYLNCKVNIASSENENNAQLTNRYNDYNPFKRTAKLKDSKVRDTMEFYNCVIFVRENNEDISTHREFTDTNTHFYAIGNVGDSKKTDDLRVNDKNDPRECVIEVTDYNMPLSEFPTGRTDEKGNKIICPVSEWKAGNTAYDYLYSEYKYEDGKFKSFGSESYEFRYEKNGITTEERQVNIDFWREAYKFVVTSDNDTFVNDFEKYFVKDSILYFYLFTERYLLVDNRAKNLFLHSGKVWYSTEEAATFKETYEVEIESKYIDDTYASFNNGYRWDLAFGYDFDTCLGIDNTGKLVLAYGQEDSDFYTADDPSSGYVYRAAESTFFCRVRDLFTTELQAMFVDRESAGAWSADGLISQWDKMQSQFPEELWRKDIERKYLRTYQGISLDGSIAGTANPRFLTEMLNGRKKYQRRMFERNQELYMATKYFGNRATSDQIMMRFNNPVGVSIKPNFTLKITPYSDMYIAYSFSSTSKQNIRAKAGIEYTIPYSGDTADITLIYGASFIQAIGDLSRCYVGDNDFSKATRLQSLIIGSDTEGYSNGYMTKISLGSNELLEYLDVKNVTGLNSVIDLSNCNNMLELHAEGSGATGAIFSNGGKLQKAYLPSITSLTVKNLNYIEEFEVKSWDTLLSLIVENTSFFNTYDIVNKAKNLTILRLIGMNWDESYQLEDSSVLDRLLKLRGIGNDGYETSVAALTGTFFAAVMKQKALETYKSTWKNLEIKYNTLVEQFAVTFVNDDGTILDVQYVDKGGNAVDPITRDINPIPVPTKESSVSTDYTFTGWDGTFTSIFAPKTITATYSESVRSYSITYKSRGTTLSGYPKTGLYGENIPYEGDIPTYTSEEAAYKYYLFTGWDKSGIIDGDKVVNAVFDICEYSDGYFNGKDLSDLRPVEVYAMTRLGLESTYVETKDSITISFGNDYTYSDVESTEIITEKTVFNGSNYVDTGIKLLDKDKDFVVAIDYKLKGETSSGGTLVQCFQSNGSNGFRLYFKSSNVSAVWGTTSQSIGTYNKREMLVLRHVKGESGLHVYFSNLDATNSLYYELDSTRSNITENSTLVFGCQRADDGEYENYAVGEIYWAKIWYADLGDSACKDLAIWTHETKKLEMSGFKNYYVSDSKRCSMTFVASELMDRNRVMNTTSSNVGGWAAMSLNKFMNDRMYKAIELQWRQLIKNVKIPSSVGGGSSTSPSTEITYSYCYLTIPALVEIISSRNSEPYSEEGKNIPFMTTSETRVRIQDGTAHSYWTRSPKADHAKYYCRIETDGSEYMYTLPNSNEDGILLELSI